MNRLRWQAILMGMVILAITGFQAYWLKDNYSREKKAVEIRTDALFHETVRNVQDSLLEEKWSIQLSADSAVGKGVKEKIFNQPVKALFPSRTARFISKFNQKRPGDSTAILNKSTGIYISVKADTPGGIRDNKDKLQFVFDSHQKVKVDEDVMVKSNVNDRSRDSLQSAGRPRKGTVVSISESRSRDSSKDMTTEVNTIIFDNDQGERFKIKIDSLISDSIPATLLKESFNQTLKQEKLDLPFTILRQKEMLPGEEDELLRRPLFGGIGYKLKLGNTFPYLIRQILLPILFSVFLVGITVFAFVLLYRSLLKQQRLAQMKNDLISNITHELKTPIATVGVAIEALKNFNAIQNPQRTKEYLEISQNELQRLGLLVDKVLKLSMLEKREIEVKYGLFDLKEVVNEVIASLRLQIEKYNARVTVDAKGDTNIKGDRLHFLSVVFNLLDNALKYSKGNTVIQVMLNEEAGNLVLKVTDNGIGIPTVYKERIFEKFFRVPTGDMHNAKGYGLGLSYIGQVVRQHKGNITVDSHEGIGSSFTITLPQNPDC